MKNERIQIGIACGKNCEHYVNFLIETALQTAAHPERIDFLLGINKKEINKELLLKNNNICNIKIIDTFSDTSGSRGHGYSLNKLLQEMEEKYGMFVDCDVAFLLKDWDIKATSYIRNDVVCFGTEYGKDSKKYMKNPNVIAMLFDAEKFKQRGFTSTPDMKYITIDETNTDIYHKEVGQEIFLDTGCHIPKFLHDHGYKGKYLELLSPRIPETKSKLKFLLENMTGDEHQLNGNPIFTHVGRSSSRSFTEDPIIIAWRKRVKEWLSLNK